jgi:hypothetical protein
VIEDGASYAAAMDIIDGFEHRSDRADWLMRNAPITRGHGPHALKFAALLARKLVARNQDTQSCVLLLEQWTTYCDPQWSRDQLRSIAGNAYVEWQKANRGPVDPWRLRAREKAAERHNANEARKSHAESNKQLAAALNKTLRYVRMIRSIGTTLPETAKVMATILGGAPDWYMRQARRPGRRPDLVAMFMKVQADGCGFTDFAADPPEELASDAREMIDMLDVRGAADFQSLEALIAHVGGLEFETVSVESAAITWRAFKRWRINRLATLACFTIDEGEELR